ncbi:hypothetical protein [Streptomyces caniscabiei]|uniref:Uncharacterized protein n=1 Tax=Streptomyces caniscabiei TaxID=2746961 RepID=A0A927L5G3_9ACTN|nr:hypothetical protein [Streptomyces caniscabiei]MBD9724314.1 hypothetical protein [Streptomyces caniscabiei]MDX3513305.1 hypothetical protein [Streptomyces caniscabiei]MDX3718806.1 hypothetical protein [Streptomyces caniscabiei]WEO21809.1 hypothetical protein IHE65_00895 [Streptomyces caniscabiei]
MAFNIGNQQGGVVNNVAGNQTVHDGQSAVFTAGGQEVRGLVRELRASIERTSLPPAIEPEVRAELDSLDKEVARPEPDREAVAGRLGRITQLLSSAGALVTAGTGLIGPLGALAGWLGALGEPILRAIGG